MMKRGVVALHESSGKNLPPERVEVAKNNKALCCKVPYLGLLDGFSTATVVNFIVLDLFFFRETALFFLFLGSAAVGTEHGWSIPQVTAKAHSAVCRAEDPKEAQASPKPPC